MKILAIDFGERRIGLAVGTSEMKMAFPREGIDTKEVSPIPYLKDLISSEKIEQIVMGMPKSEDGKKHPKAKPIKSFAWEIKEATGLGVTYQDESFSTVKAKEKTAHLSKKTKQLEKKRLDSAAAAVFLQEFLEENF